jgi:hypothetical protein
MYKLKKEQCKKKKITINNIKIKIKKKNNKTAFISKESQTIFLAHD